MNHTPGPWLLEWFDVMADGIHIAAIPDATDVAQANARLIASAPELLATLKRIIALASDDENEPTYAWKDAFEDGERAIFRAEGTETAKQESEAHARNQ